MRVIVPPIKCQGIKTKLISKIQCLSKDKKYKRWVEPFMGSGVVAFNILPEKALLCDTNPHLIAFYLALKSGYITETIVREYLIQEGTMLKRLGETYYYQVRERFNHEHSPLDFLFLNRSCFNGVMRFNSKGHFNVPFCRKPERFAQAYITKIVNQVALVRQILATKQFDFACQDFEQTFSMLTPDDFLYCDPPYIDRHTDYFNQWTEKNELKLLELLTKTSSKFILSTWKGNEFRENKYIQLYSKQFYLHTKEHYYHIGGTVDNRHPIEEALFLNYEMPQINTAPQVTQPLLAL